MHQTDFILIEVGNLGYIQTNENNPKFTDNQMKAFRFDSPTSAKKLIKNASKRIKVSADKFKLVPAMAIWNDNFELTEVKVKEG